MTRSITVLPTIASNPPLRRVVAFKSTIEVLVFVMLKTSRVTEINVTEVAVEPGIKTTCLNWGSPVRDSEVIEDPPGMMICWIESPCVAGQFTVTAAYVPLRLSAGPYGSLSGVLLGMGPMVSVFAVVKGANCSSPNCDDTLGVRLTSNLADVGPIANESVEFVVK